MFEEWEAWNIQPREDCVLLAVAAIVGAVAVLFWKAPEELIAADWSW